MTQTGLDQAISSSSWITRTSYHCSVVRFIAPAEKQDGLDPYGHARKVYRARLAGCETD